MPVDTSKLIEKAREAIQRRNYEYAIRLFQDVLTLNPGDVISRRELREVEMRRAQEGQANKSSAFFKGFAGLLKATLGRVPKSKEKCEAALVDCEKYLANDPGNYAVKMYLGRCAKNAGYLETAIYAFEELQTAVSAQTKRLVAVLRQLADAYEQAHRPAEAIEIWAQVGKLVPEDRVAHTKQRDLAAAIQTARIEEAQAKADTTIRGAVARATQSEEQKEQIAQLQRKGAGELRREEDVLAAVEDTKKEIERRPEDPRPWVKLGDLYFRLAEIRDTDQQVKLAQEAYQKAHEISPTERTIVFKQHDLEIWAREREASALAERGRAGDQPALALARQKQAKLTQFRLDSYLQRERAFPTDGTIKFRLATIYTQLHQWDEALPRYQTTQRDPRYRIPSLLYMGECFLAKNQFELAVRRFTEGIESLEVKDDRWKALKYARARAYLQKGEKVPAKADLQEIYELDVRFRDVGKLLAQLEEVVHP